MLFISPLEQTAGEVRDGAVGKWQLEFCMTFCSLRKSFGALNVWTMALQTPGKCKMDKSELRELVGW
jgi:hypothetical protein